MGQETFSSFMALTQINTLNYTIIWVRPIFENIESFSKILISLITLNSGHCIVKFQFIVDYKNNYTLLDAS